MTGPRPGARARSDGSRLRLAGRRGRLAHLQSAIPAADAELRAALLLTTALGVTVVRYLLELDALRDASTEQITELLGPCFRALAESGEPGS